MGIRGIDIQVAIQRAAEAQKLQQGETSQTRAGEAARREEAELERTRRQQQPPKSERADQTIVHPRHKGKGSGGREATNQETTEEEDEKLTPEERAERKRLEGELDILA